MEVKTNKARLNEWQKEGFQLCKKFGFIPLLIKTKVIVNADYKDIVIEEL